MPTYLRTKAQTCTSIWYEATVYPCSYPKTCTPLTWSKALHDLNPTLWRPKIWARPKPPPWTRKGQSCLRSQTSSECSEHKWAQIKCRTFCGKCWEALKVHRCCAFLLLRIHNIYIYIIPSMVLHPAKGGAFSKSMPSYLESTNARTSPQFLASIPWFVLKTFGFGPFPMSNIPSKWHSSCKR